MAIEDVLELRLLDLEAVPSTPCRCGSSAQKLIASDGYLPLPAVIVIERRCRRPNCPPGRIRSKLPDSAPTAWSDRSEFRIYR